MKKIKSSYLQKLKILIKPTSVLSVFKILHFMMKLFGLFPFKLKKSKNGPKLAICVWGVILTTVQFIGYFYCYFEVLDKKMHSRGLNAKMFTSIVDKFGSELLLLFEGLTIFSIFSSVLLTFKPQNKIFSLFCEAETRFKDKEFNSSNSFELELLELFGFSFLLFLNLFVTFYVAIRFYVEVTYKSGELIYLLVKVLPSIYIQLKSSQYVLYILMLHLGFNGLNKGMIEK